MPDERYAKWLAIYHPSQDERHQVLSSPSSPERSTDSAPPKIHQMPLQEGKSKLNEFLTILAAKKGAKPARSRVLTSAEHLKYLEDKAKQKREQLEEKERRKQEWEKKKAEKLAENKRKEERRLLLRAQKAQTSTRTSKKIASTSGTFIWSKFLVCAWIEIAVISGWTAYLWC